MRKKNKKRISAKEGIALLFGVAAIGTALWNILPTYLDYWGSEQTYDRLEREYLKVEDEEAAEEEQKEGKEQKKAWWLTDITIAFDDLKKENEEIIAWIRFDHLEELDISYPVLHSDDNEKYLRSDIYGEEHIAGSLFLEALNQPDFSDYYSIIYGHNMKDGSMFGNLDYYKEKEFWEENQYFTLYTEEKAYRYQIFSCQNASSSGSTFKIGYEPGVEYQDFIDEMVEDSIIETGIQPEDTDKILSLSTCTGSGYSSRLVVHAVCVDEQTTDQSKLVQEEETENEV